ncbi:MAG: hypothetical protein ACOC5E_02330 [Acidobacteriota bacterium]
MGFLDTLSGRRKILSYEVVFSDDSRVAASTTKHVPGVRGSDHVRMWAAHQARITQDLGFPRRTSSLLGLWLVSDVCVEPIDGRTDCFARADIADVVRYEPAMTFSGRRLHGEFFDHGPTRRSIRVNVPASLTEQELVCSSLALMQHTIAANAQDPAVLEVLRATARNLVALYGDAEGIGPESAAEFPVRAYREAIRVA